MKLNLKFKKGSGFNFKQWYHNQNKFSLVFNVLGIASVLFWLGWIYLEGIKDVEVVIPQRKQAIINLDQNAYKATSEYINFIKEYQLPDFNSLYENTEPFVEYAR